MHSGNEQESHIAIEPSAMQTAAATELCRSLQLAQVENRRTLAVLVAGSEEAADHRLGLSHSIIKHDLANTRSKMGVATTAQLVWILAPRLPEPEDMAQSTE